MKKDGKIWIDGIDTELTGQFEQSLAEVDVGSVMSEIDDARFEEAARLMRMPKD